MNKLICSSALALMIGSQAYAQLEELPLCPPPFEVGTILSPDRYPAAYNASAHVNVRTSWDAFLTCSFIYWHADQEGMDLAYPSTYTTSLQSPENSHYLTQNSTYTPGFKCGLGFSLCSDKWAGFFEYTYFRSMTSNDNSHPPEDSRGGTSVWRSTNWLNSTATTDISSTWHLNMDIIDGTVSRPYYQGRKLTVQPFAGLRSVLIRQNFHLKGLSFANPTLVDSHARSKSWSIGPRAGWKGSWLLGGGFRFEGDMAANLLYTRFSSVVYHDQSASINFDELNLLRPSADMELGLGWGSYFDQQNYHFDVSASYSFNVMWGQNQMRSLVDEYRSSVGAEPGDLHLHGVNATLRLDF